MKSWIRNILGFLSSLIKRFAFGFLKAKEIKNIFNYYKVPHLFDTSGQPSKQQLNLLAKNGYEVVINLAPNSLLQGSVVNEAEILESQQVKYIHLPVDFNNPTNEDFANFVSTIDHYKDKKLWVHCAANMRVSAFVYKYRRDILKLSHDEIIGDMKAIWTPNKIWNAFLGLNNKF
tara:strand:- start:1262 stop:1786 length:525 start_codon:yes stop_codon:yes gene_type:complete